MARTQLNWRVGHTADPQQPPTNLVPASVPGAVQLDWARAQGWPQPEYDNDVSRYRWMEDVYWVYQTVLQIETSLETAPIYAKQRIFFVCKGVDYQFEVRLNGKVLHAQEGMFRAVELDLTDIAKSGDVLDVLVFPAPKSCATPVDRNQANQSVKPAVSYGWDFHPRLVPLGIWDETYLETRPECHIRSAEVKSHLEPNFQRAVVVLDVALSQVAVGFKGCWRILSPDGQIVEEFASPINDTHLRLVKTIFQPKLWWPNGQGDPNLYTSIFEVLNANSEVIHNRVRKFGLRRVRLVMHPTQWQEQEVMQFPKGRHTSPITLEINGRCVFAKGANWVSPSMFPGTIDKETYRPLLDRAKQSNFNILRCWGGAIVQKEAFFEMCDARGLMIWQEFTLACNRYEGNQPYLEVLDAESRAIITRLRQHACLVMWCGGNELFNNWSMMTDQDLALRLLNKNCYELDRDTPFLMTSPSMGMAHGGYFFRRPDGAEVYQYFAESHNTAYTEYGVTAPANIDILRKIIPAAELFPPKLGTQWEVRHALGAWEPSSWLDLPTIEHYFGPPQTLEQLVEWGQWLQSEGYKAIFEEARRQKPVCAMAINWCLNEPWPNAANNSLITWPCEPKPALQSVAQSCRPVLASARIPKFSWQTGEHFEVQLFVLNDGVQPIDAIDIEATITCSEQTLTLGRWQSNETLVANTNLQGPTVSVTLPALTDSLLILALTWHGHPEWSSLYRLHAKPVGQVQNEQR